MSTSGTVATTIIDSAAMIEHAFRRAKVPPAQQTPETVQIARENLYFILLNLSNRGLNLWAVEKKLLSLQPYKATYETAAGTLDVLNVVLSTPTLTSSVLSQTVVTPPARPSTAESWGSTLQRSTSGPLSGRCGNRRQWLSGRTTCSVPATFQPPTS